MTHTSTEQPEALRLAEFFESMRKSSHRWYDGTPVHEKAAAELRRLHARVQELEASQAQRVPVQCVVPPQINQMLNRRMYATGWADCLRAHGITQEKQG